MPRMNPNSPYGLRPVQRLDGAVWRDSLVKYAIPAAQTNVIYIGDPVIKVTGAATTTLGVPAINLAGATGPITGVLCGFDIDKGTFASSGSPGPLFRPAATSQVFYGLVNTDPQAEFVVQANDATGNGFLPSMIGKNANLLPGAGSPFTGWSGWMLDLTTVATTATLQVNIVRVLEEYFDNTIGQPWIKLVVRLNTATEVSGQPGI